MKYTILILICLIVLGCKQKTKENTVTVDIKPKKEVADNQEEIKEIKAKKQPKIERWFEPTELDTTLYFKNFNSIALKNTDSIYISEYYLEKRIIDSLTKIHNNSHQKAIEIENYLLKTNTEFVKKDSLGLHLKMVNDSWKLISLNPNTDEADNTFEYYFQEFGFYSVRTQWGEGNGFKLINDKNGEITDLFGRPYFSENGDYVISVNVDIEAGYSRNGFQLFQNSNGKLKEIGNYEPNGWGPYSAKWKDNSTVILKSETVEFKDGEMNYIDFYSELKIK